MTKGRILNVQRFCTDDGPGIRTTVFFKGCPLSCVWCHNPESQGVRSELAFDAEKCIRCGQCRNVCGMGCHSLGEGHAYHRANCAACGACADACPVGALTRYGTERTAAEVLEELVRDRVFYETSGGGITLSGGEPLLQPQFAAEILKGCREKGIHTAVETCGFAEQDVLCAVAEHCDLILFDVKETDCERHLRYTGAPLAPILANLRRVDRMGIPVIIRAPIVPTINDRESHFAALKALKDSLSHCEGVRIMPYHRTGSYKYALLGKAYSCGEIAEPAKETVAAWERLV